MKKGERRSVSPLFVSGTNTCRDPFLNRAVARKTRIHPCQWTTFVKSGDPLLSEATCDRSLYIGNHSCASPSFHILNITEYVINETSNFNYFFRYRA